MSKKVNITNKVANIIREVLDERTVAVEKSVEEMIQSLSKEIKKPITKDDKGNYSVCECEPHHVGIRHIVHDIFDLQYFKDGADRQKKLYVKFDEAKKLVKNWLSSEDLNYVDSAYSKVVENTKDKEGGKKADASTEGPIVLDPEKDNKPAKEVKAKNMNKEEDDPTQPMREVGKFEKQIDHKIEKPSYKPPTLPKNLQKLVIKYTKNGKKRKN